MIHPALAEAAALHAFPGGYGLAYGSHATDTAGEHSDLDLLYIGVAPLSSAEHTRLIDAVKDLHHRHRLDLDEEVPYRSKLYATLGQVADAVALGGFEPLGAAFRAPATIREAWFLDTEAFRLRLVFNALTSPHVFLGGDVTAYRSHVAAAERSAVLLADAIHGRTTAVPTVAAAALWRAPDGRTGKDYLGYLHGPHLLSVTAQGLAASAVPSSGAATPEDYSQPVR